MSEVITINERTKTFFKLKKVCKEICLRHNKINEEISTIKTFLGMVQTYAVSYSDQDLKSHLKNINIKIHFNILKKISVMLDGIDNSASKEMFRNVDLFNIHKQIPNMDSQKDILLIVFAVNKILDNLIYQFDRIVENEFDKEKQVAILKGIIALY